MASVHRLVAGQLEDALGFLTQHHQRAQGVACRHKTVGGSKAIALNGRHRYACRAMAAAAKAAVLYLLVAKLICGVMADRLLATGTLKEPMLKALPATFSWPQLFTALIGGAVALLIVPVLRKALHR